MAPQYSTLLYGLIWFYNNCYSGKSRIEEVAEHKVEAPKAPRSSAIGARTEAPKVPSSSENRGAEGCGVWGGVSPSPLGDRFSRLFFQFGAQNGEIWCILGGILKNATNSVSMALAC